MKALRFHRHGGPEVLQWDEVPDAVAGPGQVLVRVVAFGVNWADLLMRQGRYPGAPDPPYVAGHDFTGVVAAHGPGVAGPALGSRVFGVLPRPGAHAELLAVPAVLVYPVPDATSDEEAAGVAAPYFTADAAITTMGRLQAGEDVLVHAAAGAFGSASVQLCRAYGAGRIIATAGSAEKCARTHEWGADVAVDYTTEDFAAVVAEVTGGRGVQLVLESVGGDVLGRSFDCLEPAGRLVSVGASSGRSSGRFRLHTLFEKGVSVAGFTLGFWLQDHLELVRPSIDRVVDGLRRGVVRPVIGGVFEAGDIAEAHAFLEGRRSIGRTVVRFPADGSPF